MRLQQLVRIGELHLEEAVLDALAMQRDAWRLKDSVSRYRKREMS